MLWCCVSKLKQTANFGCLNAFRNCGHRCNLSSFIVAPGIQDAIASKKAVVGLESTVITHGMPYPSNMETALGVEEIIRENGAVPATIGVLDGILKIGLSPEEIESLANASTPLVKISRRDLAFSLGKKQTGGTTVSATMLACYKAGIQIFATGGIGGVHRGANLSFDVSADLTELGRTPVAVVCAGVKSILDIGLTLEYLETQGVPVFTYHSSFNFPAFFSPQSSFKAPCNLDSAREVAACIYENFSLGLENGLLIAVPIPPEAAADGQQIDGIIHAALREASDSRVSGRDVTPFVLKRIHQMSDGKSLQANIALLRNNAKVAAEIACELSKMVEAKEMPTKRISTRSTSCGSRNETRRPVVIGGSVFDVKATAYSVSPLAEATNTGRVHQSFGGVARNVAECLTRLGWNPLLVTAVGEDRLGDMLLADMRRLGMDTSGVIIARDQSTAGYSMLAKPDGELLMAVGDMKINEGISVTQLLPFESFIRNASIVVIDGNFPADVIQHVLRTCMEASTPVWFEPTTFEKAYKPFAKGFQPNLTYSSPNQHELGAMWLALNTDDAGLPKVAASFENMGLDTDDFGLLRQRCIDLSRVVSARCPNILLSLGKHGVLDIRRTSSGSSGGSGRTLDFQHYPAMKEPSRPIDIKSVSGAGDSFVGGFIHGLLLREDRQFCIKSGLYAAYLSLGTFDTISAEVAPEKFNMASFNALYPLDAPS